MARSRVAKWPDIGATSSTRGCGTAMSFLKCSRVGERRAQRRLLGDRHHSLPTRHRARSRRGAAHGSGRRGRASRRRPERLRTAIVSAQGAAQGCREPRRARRAQGLDGRHQIRLGLIGLVQHSPRTDPVGTPLPRRQVPVRTATAEPCSQELAKDLSANASESIMLENAYSFGDARLKTWRHVQNLRVAVMAAHELTWSGPGAIDMAKAVLTISSKNYSSWSLRGWLLCKMAGLDFEEKAPVDRRSRRARRTAAAVAVVPDAGLDHDGLHVWDTLAIAEYLAEMFPKARTAAGRPRRAHPLPLGFRRNAFGLRQSALGPADEHQGAFSRFQGLGRRASPTSTASARSGATA